MSKQPNQPGKDRKAILAIWGGLVAALLLLGLGGWYLLNLKPPSGTDTSIVNNSVSSGSETSEIPDRASGEETLGTPAPGFRDDFSNDLSPAWTIHFGDPIIKDGWLTSHVGAGLAAGDPSWKNYQVEFDVDTSQTSCGLVDSSNSVGVRIQDFDHAYWFVFDDCLAAWSLFAGGVQDGILNLLPDTRAQTTDPQKHVVITVEENQMSASVNGTLTSSMIDTQWKNGGIFLQVEAGTEYDNFQVTLLP